VTSPAPTPRTSPGSRCATSPASPCAERNTTASSGSRWSTPPGPCPCTRYGSCLSDPTC
jgi:hypothetical protein